MVLMSFWKRAISASLSDMTKTQPPTHDLIQAAQEMADHRRGKLSLPTRGLPTAYAVEELEPETVDAIAKSKMDTRHEPLNTLLDKKPSSTD